MKYENLFQEIKRKDVTTTAWSLGAPCKKKKNQTNREKKLQQVRTCSKEILEACDTWAIKCKQQKKDIPQVTFFPGRVAFWRQINMRHVALQAAPSMYTFCVFTLAQS